MGGLVDRDQRYLRGCFTGLTMQDIMIHDCVFRIKKMLIQVVLMLTGIIR